MKNNYTQVPPKWAPDAVPSMHGWKDSKTGELLVSVRGLKLAPLIDEMVEEGCPLPDEIIQAPLDERVETGEVLDEREPETPVITEVVKPKTTKKPAKKTVKKEVPNVE